MNEIRRAAVDIADDKAFHQIIERIWQGRRSMLRVAINPDRPDPQVDIVVGEDLHRALWSYGRQIERTAVASHIVFAMRPLHLTDDVYTMESVMLIFGMRVVSDRALNGLEMRFRSEIAL